MLEFHSISTLNTTLLTKHCQIKNPPRESDSYYFVHTADEQNLPSWKINAIYLCLIS